jgi:adenine phosphoribosyltransferase
MTLNERLTDSIRTIPDFPKKGINFKDIMPIFRDVVLVQDSVEAFADELKNLQVDAICAIESRGFLMGTMLAAHMEIPFIPIRKEGKLPGDTINYAYNLEYGTAVVEVQTGAIESDMRVVIHDDLLATGGTAKAAAELIHMHNAKVSAFAFLVELTFLGGKQIIEPYSNNIVTMVEYDNE